MASVQERLQLKRVPLENWSLSEQLHLASAVACGGDQNWMSVSRSLKLACGQNRPNDWFSQKSCAAQYEKLLENAGTSKRKKRTEKDTAAQVVETPIELIVRRLTQERVAELNKLIQEERDEYISIKAEVEAVHSNEFDEEHLREMCLKIEAEEKQREKDKAKYNQWLKEREERKREFEKSWRTNSGGPLQQQAPSNPPQPIKIEEMEIIDDSNTKQATSPLLTSLLKSPSAAPNPSPAMLNTMPNQSRVSAPTITNLLTTGTVPNMTAHTQASTSAGIVYSTQMQNQPLSGPPVPAEPYPGSLTPTPSQAAPTLSMLLESKHKDSPTKLNAGGTLDAAGNKHEPHAEHLSTAELAIKDEDQQLMDAFSDLIPDDIDVLAGMILDDLISEEQDAAVSSVAECLENEAMAAASSVAGDEAGPGVACDAAGLMGLADIKSEPSTVNENACDGMQFTHGAGAVDEAKAKGADAVDVKQFQPKDEDSSDLSNDTPLSELIKQEASAKQQRLLQEQQQHFQLEQKRHDGDTQQSQLKQDTEPTAQPEVGEQQPQQPTEPQTQAEQTEGERLQQDDHGLSDAELGLDLDDHDIEPLGDPSESADLDGNDIQQSGGQGVLGDDTPGALEVTGCIDPVESAVDPAASVGQNEGDKEGADAEESSNGPDVASLEPSSSAVDPMDFLASDSNDNDAAPFRPSADANVQPPDDGPKVALDDDDVPTEPMTVAGEQLEPEIDEPLDAIDNAELSNDAMDSIAVDVTKNHGSDVNGTAVDNAEASGESAAKGDDQPADGGADMSASAVDEVVAPATEAKMDDILTDDEGDGADGGDGANEGDEAMQEAGEAAGQMAATEQEAEPAAAAGEAVDEVMGDDAATKNEGNGKTGGLEGPVDGGVNGDEKDGNEAKRTDADVAVAEHDEHEKHVESELDDASEKSEQPPIKAEQMDSPHPTEPDEPVEPATKSPLPTPDAAAPAAAAAEAGDVALAPGDIKTELADADAEPSGDDPFAFVGDADHSDAKAVKIEKRSSTDDELFEDAKETLDDAGERKEKATGDGPKPKPMAVATPPPSVAAVVETDTATTSKTTTPTPSVTIDTDDDAPIEVIKEYKGGRKRDYSRRRHDTSQSFDKSVDESVDDNASISSRLRMKDRDRSESPYVDDELNEPLNKYKRRYSSTPIPDSLPNSPASSEDREREYRGWKKSIMLVFNAIHDHRFASIFAKPINDDHAPDYRGIVLNPMDLQTLKRNIDSGAIRTTIDFKRAVMFMCHNAIFYNMNDTVTCTMARTMLGDALQRIDDFNETWLREKENEKNATSSSSAMKAVRGRKSTRLN